MDVVFLDASVLFSAAYRADAKFTLLWRLSNTRGITSGYAAEEALRNLSSEEQRQRLNKLLEFAEIVPEAPAGRLPHGVRLPEKDAPILLAAIQAGATHLLTSDKKHFGAYFGRTVSGVLILPPGEYLHRRGSGQLPASGRDQRDHGAILFPQFGPDRQAHHRRVPDYAEHLRNSRRGGRCARAQSSGQTGASLLRSILSSDRHRRLRHVCGSHGWKTRGRRRSAPARDSANRPNFIGIGLALGLPAALAATKLISSRLFGLTATDPMTIGAAILVISSISMLAGYLPARRAAKVDPMLALRWE